MMEKQTNSVKTVKIGDAFYGAIDNKIYRVRESPKGYKLIEVK